MGPRDQGSWHRSAGLILQRHRLIADLMRVGGVAKTPPGDTASGTNANAATLGVRGVRNYGEMPNTPSQGEEAKSEDQPHAKQDGQRFLAELLIARINPEICRRRAIASAV